jgi:predicted Zn-dependent protease
MKTWFRFAAIMVLGLGAVVISEKRQVDVPASADAILYLVADTEQELTRLPVSFTRMSDEEEIRIGNDLARAYRPLPSNETTQREANSERVRIEDYLAEVGSRIEVHAHRKLPYRFHYVPEPGFINAFALPGGHVYLGAGLLRLMDSEDELASVIGHEIEHIDHYHCAERVQQEMALRKIPFGGLIGLPIEIFEAGYSKNQELEADREGVRLTVASGYSPSGAVRLFEKFDRLYHQRYHKAQTPEEELSQVAEQTLEGYFRSHPLPSERIQQVEKLIATQNWSIRPERDLKVAYIFLSERAADELAGHRYAEAEKLARRSLAMHSGTLQALKVLATSQFAQAKFRAAADSYRLASEADPADGDLVNSYARALAATGDRQRVLDEFREWLQTREKTPSYTLPIALAGLELMAGNQARAQQLVAAAQASPDNVPSNSLSDLGWWYYLAGQYPKAIDVLAKAVQLRPGERTIAERLAWAEIETSRYGDALQVLSSVDVLASASQYGTRTHHSDMVWAVAQWRGMQDEAAIRRFAVAIESQPEWNNDDWVKANYSPEVVRTVDDLRARQDKRPKKFLAQPS